jgi:hypothetical protein
MIQAGRFFFGSAQETENIPETDFFFHNLYALGAAGEKILRRFAVFSPDDSGATEKRFKALLGPGARDRFKYYPRGFEFGILEIAVVPGDPKFEYLD